MYLKRLEIQGFKSFARQTTLEFLPPQSGRFSITGIVGPNGAGKSNVTDAIRWVMGEQALKNVRAKKSEDVIFNGSELKGALGAAEVTMVLDNTGSETGLDFPEVVITRRLYRSGESEYLVNNQASRLLDIHLLLARAQFAEHAYSIVSQGMIDRLLTVSPSERKDWFDEASGIKEHQIKQHQASLKLARSENNMREAETLLTEVTPRLKLLAKQVKKLERRQEVEIELTAAQESYYLFLYRANKTEIDFIKHNLEDVDKKYRNAFDVLSTIQSELAELAKGASRHEVFQELQLRHQAAVKTVNDLERSRAILEGQMHTEYSQAGAQNVAWLNKKVGELRHAAEESNHKIETAEKESAQSESRSTEHKRSLETFSIEQTQIKLSISRLQSDLFKDQSEREYSYLSGFTAVKAVLEGGKKFGKIFGLVGGLGDVGEDCRLALEVAAGHHLSSIVVEDEEVAKKAIDYLRINKFGVATFLPLNKIQPRGTYGDSDRFLGQSGVIGKAIDLVKFDPKFQNIFSLVLGNTLVVESLAVAQRLGIGTVRMVTLEGDLVEPKGIIRGGYRNRKNAVTFSSKLSESKEDRLNEIQSEINLRTHQLTELESKLEKAKLEQVQFAVAAESAKQKVQLLNDESRTAAIELASLEQELKLAEASPKEYSQQLKTLGSEKETLTKKLSASQSAVKKIEIEIENFNNEEEKKKQRVFKLQEQMQAAQTTVNGILNQRSDYHIQLAKVETKQEDLAKEVMSDMKVSLEMLVARIGDNVGARYIVPVQELADTIQKLKYQLSLIGGIDEEVIKEYSETKERHDFLTGQLSDLTVAVRDLHAMIEELDELMKKKRAVAFKKIRKEFDRYFKILFNGGTADLEEAYGEPVDEGLSAQGGSAFGGEGQAGLVSPPYEGGAHGVVAEAEDAPRSRKQDKILTGIDIIANPPGKKVKYLSMLSGGERTLTSIALICAILYHNPSPFVVLDEVEAALDEANTQRFASIMGELSTRSQFIVVTHNRVTMHAADALYGVVMGADGISKLLSVKMEEVGKYTEQAGIDSKA
ncbi:MAG: hypothetical protein EXS55_01355 [Candidatus Magasanikbacteria bacterium]|nr:hypothetical protein [Candidatus Magasanikbacteria bacterium]